ncbi:MAG TPA: hypothetical protein VEL31_16070 [Ktedonobacteraceae bacterium]|nr:hypothetical protein [Ktedonobacteraceae bacterium]
MTGNCHARCEAGEKREITSNSYLSLYQLMSALAIVRFWTLALLAYVFLEEERARLQQQWQRPVTIGEARREIQRRHRRQVLDWLHDQFQSGVLPDSLYDQFAA